MRGERRVQQATVFYTFSLEDHLPKNHLLRSIDRFVALEGLRRHLARFYSAMGRPSIDPELLIRMMLVGCCFGIRSKPRLCVEFPLDRKRQVRHSFDAAPVRPSRAPVGRGYSRHLDQTTQRSPFGAGMTGGVRTSDVWRAEFSQSRSRSASQVSS